MSETSNKQAQKRMVILTPEERRRLAGETLVTEFTIRRWERGEEIRSSIKKYLTEAAKKLGFPIPDGRKL